MEGTAHLMTVMLGLALVATAVAMLFRDRIVARFADAIGAPGPRRG